ncbi:MAG: hypothetical protein V3V67_08575 [Myxococcota bacterium]
MAEQPAALDRAGIMKALRGLGRGETDIDSLPPEVIDALEEMMKASKDEIAARYERRREWERSSPKPGMKAPDFELELLSPQGKRTGEMRRLSDYRGRPVALTFGSYT